MMVISEKKPPGIKWTTASNDVENTADDAGDKIEDAADDVQNSLEDGFDDVKDAFKK